MELIRTRQALLLTYLVALLSQNIVVSSATYFDDQKNYYTPTPTPDPNASPPPAVTYNPPPYSSGGGHASPTPSHGTPSHGTPSHGSPPANCGNPPTGGHRRSSPPSGGGYYRPPPTSTPTPTTPTTPTPTYGTPPTTPINPPTTPTTPTIPSPPFAFDPNSPPFTCTYWRNHPALIWALFGWLGNMGSAFGGTIPATGANMNLLQALSNTRTDGLGELYREGTASLLNSMAHTRFPYTSNQVRDSFVRALSSNKAAGAQAQLFKMANEGRMRPRA